MAVENWRHAQRGCRVPRQAVIAADLELTLASSGHLAVDVFAEVFDDEFLAVWGVLSHVES